MEKFTQEELLQQRERIINMLLYTKLGVFHSGAPLTFYRLTMLLRKEVTNVVGYTLYEAVDSLGCRPGVVWRGKKLIFVLYII